MLGNIKLFTTFAQQKIGSKITNNKNNKNYVLDTGIGVKT